MGELSAEAHVAVRDLTENGMCQHKHRLMCRFPCIWKTVQSSFTAGLFLFSLAMSESHPTPVIDQTCFVLMFIRQLLLYLYKYRMS